MEYSTRGCGHIHHKALNLIFLNGISPAALIDVIMQVTVNGQNHLLSPDVNTAGSLLTNLNIARERVAVVINEDVVRRADLDNTALADGDTIEIITMVGGG